MRGYFGIGICHGKNEVNVGTLWRSANILGASFIFTIGRRYRQQSSDTLKSPRHVPLFHYDNVPSMKAALPWSCLLVGVELCDDAVPIADFEHPERAVYLLGAEDHGLTGEEMDACHRLVRLPGDRSLNVATAGSIVMYDRVQRRAR